MHMVWHYYPMVKPVTDAFKMPECTGNHFGRLWPGKDTAPGSLIQPSVDPFGKEAVILLPLSGSVWLLVGCYPCSTFHAYLCELLCGQGVGKPECDKTKTTRLEPVRQLAMMNFFLTIWVIEDAHAANILQPSPAGKPLFKVGQAASLSVFLLSGKLPDLLYLSCFPLLFSISSISFFAISSSCPFSASYCSIAAALSPLPA